MPTCSHFYKTIKVSNYPFETLPKIMAKRTLNNFFLKMLNKKMALDQKVYMII